MRYQNQFSIYDERKSNFIEIEISSSKRISWAIIKKILSSFLHSICYLDLKVNLYNTQMKTLYIKLSLYI
jgi:hypothetical protein